MLLCISLITTNITLIASAWGNGSNGGFTTDPYTINYGTHDWLAEHALVWLPNDEIQYILDNKNEYLYGTELPDKPSTEPDGIGDTAKQHVYYNSTLILQDDAACVRAQEEYDNVIIYLYSGDYANAARSAGVMAHYITAVSMYGNVMNETYWGAPVNSTIYSNYVNTQTTSYTSAMFDSYLDFDGTLESSLDAYNGAQEVAYDTTFDNQGDKTCKWMDDNYDWGDTDFKARCGASLNFATNLLADVLHKIYLDILAPSKPTGLAAKNPTGSTINLTWNANLEENIMGYSIYINDTDSDSDFHLLTNVSGVQTTITGLADETTFYFRIKAYNGLFKASEFSNTASSATLDITSPNAPKINTPPSVTSRTKINISGFAEPDATVEVYVNGDLTATLQAGEPPLGFFRLEIILNEGVNNITARAIDAANNPSPISEPQYIIMDSIKPVASAGPNQALKYGAAPLTIVLNGSKSYDTGTGITNYTWRFPESYLTILYGEAPRFVLDNVGYYLIELNVTDDAENWDTDVIWVNITLKDITPPTIVLRTPEVNETDVPVNITISAKFNEAINETALNFELYNEDTSTKLTFGISIDYQKDGRTIIINMLGNLSYNTTYNVTIFAEDLEGNNLVDGTWKFVTVPPPPDADGDGMLDSWEELYGLDPTKDDSKEDLDGDGLSNLEEYKLGANSTDPTDSDTDDDTLPDGWEARNSLDPHDPGDATRDSDSDGFNNLEEFLGPDGVPEGYDSTDPQDPLDYPGAGTVSAKEDDELEAWVIYTVVVIVLLIMLLILGLALRHFNRQRAAEGEKKEKKEDDYFKIKSKDELGVGGELLSQDELGYHKDDKYKEPPEDDDDEGYEIVKCPKCGAKLDAYTDYCYECGEILKKKKDKKKELKTKKKELTKLKSKTTKPKRKKPSTKK